MYILGVSLLSFYTTFLLESGTVLTVWYFFFHFIYAIPFAHDHVKFASVFKYIYIIEICVMFIYIRLCSFKFLQLLLMTDASQVNWKG